MLHSSMTKQNVSRYLGPEMEYRDEEQREDQVMQDEIVSNLLCHLQICGAR